MPITIGAQDAVAIKDMQIAINDPRVDQTLAQSKLMEFEAKADQRIKGALDRRESMFSVSFDDRDFPNDVITQHAVVGEMMQRLRNAGYRVSLEFYSRGNNPYPVLHCKF